MMKNKCWVSYKLIDIFPSIQRGKRLKKDDHQLGNMPYISSTSFNNGVDAYLSNSVSVRIFSQCLTLANSGSVGSSFYHSYSFVASDHVTSLKNKLFSKPQYLFMASLTVRLSEKYGFNREINDKRIKKERILLPVNSDQNPDYDYMESYIRSLQTQKEKNFMSYISKRLDELKDIKKPEKLDKKKWYGFLIEEVCSIVSGKDIYEAERISGNTPYVSSTANQNGIGYFVGNTNATLEEGCLSVNRNGSVGYSFFHPYKALFSNDCRKLRPFNQSRYVGLFLSNQITLQKEKYGYGYKMGTARLKKQRIMLPINDQNQPDYEYMEQYMKYLEYQKLKAYLDFKGISL